MNVTNGRVFSSVYNDSFRIPIDHSCPLNNMVRFKETQDQQNDTHTEKNISHILFHDLLTRDDVHRFVHTCTFSRQDGLIDSKTARRDRDKTTVRRNFVPHCDGDNVTRNELRGMNPSQLTRADDFGFVWRIFPQCL